MKKNEDSNKIIIHQQIEGVIPKHSCGPPMHKKSRHKTQSLGGKCLRGNNNKSFESILLSTAIQMKDIALDGNLDFQKWDYKLILLGERVRKIK